MKFSPNVAPRNPRPSLLGQPRHALTIGLLLAMLMSLACCGSSAIQQLKGPPPGIGPRKLLPSELQTEVMAIADTYATQAAEIWDRAAASTTSPEARSVAHERKIGSMTSSLAIASGTNPLSSFCDIIVLVTLQRQAMELESSTKMFPPEAATEIIESYRQLDEEAWKAADRTLFPVQVQELKDLTVRYRETFPDRGYVGLVRITDLSRSFNKAQMSPASTTGASSLLSLVMLDPLASLDPAAREVEQARLLGERMFYYLQRAPYLLRWQAEGLYYDVASAPESQTAIQAAERASKAAEQISQVAERLPQDLATERKAAIEQVSAAVTDQRNAIFDQLDASQKPVDEMLTRTQQTAAEMRGLATAIGDASVKVDQMMARFDKPKSPDTPPAPPGKPVTMEDIAGVAREAKATIEQATLLTQELQKTLAMPAWKDRQADITTITKETHEHVSGLIDQVFIRALILAIVTPIAVVGALLVYRRVTRRPA